MGNLTLVLQKQKVKSKVNPKKEVPGPVSTPIITPLYCRDWSYSRALCSGWFNWGWLPWPPLCVQTRAVLAQNTVRYLSLIHI